MTTDADRVRASLADAKARIGSADRDDIERQAKLAADQISAAKARVRMEYRLLGLDPPSECALSITARRELGMPLPAPATEQESVG